MSTSSTVSKLSDLPGLAGAKRLVRRLAMDDAGVHAVLFYGAPGSGKEELARILVKSWLCLNPDAEGADGTCRPCSTFERGANPDFVRITPVGASSIIRQSAIDPSVPPDLDYPTPIRPFFRTQPISSRHKVALIEDAHRMLGPASNALLKTLEEPHSHVKLVLTTDSISMILPTVLSRCLAVACAVPEKADVEAHYPEATEEFYRLSEGAPLRLQQMIETPEPYRRLYQFGESLKSRTAQDVLVTSDEFRQIAEGLSPNGARASNAEALSLLATYLARDPGTNPRWAQLVIESHRRIVANGSALAVCDSLFSRMLTS